MRVEKQERNLTTKRTKRTKKKGKRRLAADKIVTLLYGKFYCLICAVSVFFFVRFVRFVVKILAFLLLEIHHQIELL